MILWEVLGVSIFSLFLLFSLEQNLLSRGVQSDSDLEELDDEVRAIKHFLFVCNKRIVPKWNKVKLS